MQYHNYLRSKATQLSLLFCNLLFNILIQAQSDFNHYTTLLSKGPIPEDFTTTSAQKVKQGMLTYQSKLSPTKKRVFLETIYYNIDEILHSGSVIYGDEITLYVETVARNLLKNDHELQGKLRFYTIKSNTANALSTDQGIIFVTTGLIAQLTSEAQLAYVLSHEIAHYTEKHVSETFNLKQSKIRTSERIKTLSAHSREHELEADKLALKLYHEAGYDDDEVISTFDVLMYSYLPFDEVPISKEYFQSEQLYIPDSYFSTKEYPIKTNEDYDDHRSSHPNIRKRKDAVLEVMRTYNNWGNYVNTLGESKFKYIRNLARFESLRTDILDGRYAQALYSVFLLEKEFPQSVYIQQIKAHAWLGLTQLKEAGKMNETLPSSKEYEGESAALYYFLNKLNLQGVLTLATRNIYDIRQRFPEDTILFMIQESLIRKLAKTDQFNWSDYSDRNFNESAQAKIKEKNTSEQTENTTTASEQSKYEKIRNKKNIHSPESFDSSRFYLYGISDIIKDSVFHEKYISTRKAIKNAQDQQLALYPVNKKRGFDYTSLPPIDLDKLLVLEPKSSCIHEKNGPLWAKKDRSEKMMLQALTLSAKKQNIELVPMLKNNLETQPTLFNQRNMLSGLVEQSLVIPEAEFVPVDYQLLKSIELSTGSSNVLFSYSNYKYEAQLDGFFFLYCIVFPPAILYVPFAAAKSHQLSTSVMVMNITTGRVQAMVYNQRNGQPSAGRYSSIYLPILKYLALPE